MSNRLIPFNKIPSEQHKAISSAGGRSVSPAKKNAAKIRELRKKSFTDATAKELLEIIQNPSSSLLDTRRYIRDLELRVLSVSQAIQLGHLMVSWHKACHGEKRMLAAVSLDLTLSEEDRVELLEQLSRTR